MVHSYQCSPRQQKICALLALANSQIINYFKRRLNFCGLPSHLTITIYKLCRMLRVVQYFGKHCSCHLQGDYVFAGRFWYPYVELGDGRSVRWKTQHSTGHIPKSRSFTMNSSRENLRKRTHSINSTSKRLSKYLSIPYPPVK
jgi:hypothetical protein